MASRIFWILLAGIAAIGGMIMQGDGGIFSWGDERRHVSDRTGPAIEARVEHAIERGFDKMEVVGSDGQEIEVPRETKRALADAVGRLVKAETDLALLRVRDGSSEEMAAAQIRSDRARADVETLKGRIEAQKAVAAGERDVIGEQIRTEIREDIRATVREAVRN